MNGNSSHIYQLLLKSMKVHYGPITGTAFFMDLSFFISLILSYCFRLQTMRRISMRSCLSHALHIFANMCLPHDKPYAIKPNFILDSSFLCCALHMFMLLFHFATAIWLPHVSLS